LGRTTSVLYPDTNAATTSYNGLSTTVTGKGVRSLFLGRGCGRMSSWMGCDEGTLQEG